MKRAFIPIALRPSVSGSSFSVSNTSHAVNEIVNINSINQILNLSSRHMLIAKVIKHVVGTECSVSNDDMKSIKLLESMFFNADDN